MAFDKPQRQNEFKRNNFRKDSRGPRRDRREEQQVQKVWTPKTSLGKEVLAGKYSTIQEVLLTGKKILESEITDFLVPGIQMEFINVGQAKGKFGGGKRKPSKPTQKKTSEGNKMSFTMLAVCGNKDGVVGLGIGKARETVPAREKAIAAAKKNLLLTRRGSGDWGSSAKYPNSIPFSIVGKAGSSEIKLMPAPVGTGLVVEKEVKKILELAGIKDVWSKNYGNTKNKVNLLKAAFDALLNLQKVKINPTMMKGKILKEGDKDEQY